MSLRRDRATPETGGRTEDSPPSEMFPRVRPRTRFARRFYARYVEWTERIGYTLALLIIGGVLYSFFRPADDLITGSGNIVPRAEAVKAATPVRVTRVFVADLSAVQPGDALVEVADTKTGATQMLTAPIGGQAHVAEDLEGKEFEADAPIAEVLDPNDLRITTNLNGETVADARVGQPATITAILPDYGSGVVLRADVQGTDGGKPQRIVASGALDKSVRDALRDALKGRTITRRDDLPFIVKDVKDLEVSADVTASPIRETAAQLSADPSPLLTLSGTVAEGKHKITVQIADLPPEVREQTAALVAKRLQGSTLPTARVEDVKNIRFVVRIVGENTTVTGATAALKAEARRTALEGASQDRGFEATIRLSDVPEDLRKTILALYAGGHTVRAAVSVHTGSRPFALTLLKK